MKIEYDEQKNQRNIRERSLPFCDAVHFEWERAQISEDVRHQYSERRYIAVSYLAERLHVLCFTPVPGGIRVISFRKANSREVKRYVQATD